MRGIFNVFWFTFREQARKKSFIISTVIIYVLIIGALCVPAIINSFSNKAQPVLSSNTKNTVYVIDSKKVITNNLSEFSKTFNTYKVELKQPSQKAMLMSKVKNDGSKSLIVISLNNGSPSYDYYFKNITDTGGPDTDDVSNAIKKIYGENLLAKGGVSPKLINSALADVTHTSNALGRGTASGMIASYAVIFILFMAIYMYGYWVAMSIASEKTSRVMEVLITSTKPSHIVIGKALGMGILGLCQLLGIIIVGTSTYFLAFPKNYQIGGVAINLSNFSPFAVAMMIIYFILGFALYSMINAVCGATVSRAEDIKQAITPVSIISILSFYFAYATMFMPDSAASCAASLIPFSSPFAMPSRILNASVPVWQVLLSLVLLAATTALLGFISIKLYSSAVLHYGKRLKISELVHMSKSN